MESEDRERKVARRAVRDAIGVGLGQYFRRIEELPLTDRLTSLLQKFENDRGGDKPEGDA